MFKVKLEKTQSKILETVKVTNNNKYTYVISDNVRNFEEGKINIIFSNKNKEEVEELVKSLVLNSGKFINCESLKGIKRINIRDIDYIETYDNEVYAIIGKERYTINEKLYMLEEELDAYDFIRISKSIIVNITRIDYIKPMFNCKLKLVLLNQDIVEVNRTYIKSFKEKIKN